MAAVMERLASPGHIFGPDPGSSSDGAEQDSHHSLLHSSSRIQAMMNSGEIPEHFKREFEVMIQKMQMLKDGLDSSSRQQQETPDASDTNSNSGSTTPCSDHSMSPKSMPAKPYQATVEDVEDGLHENNTTSTITLPCGDGEAESTSHRQGGSKRLPASRSSSPISVTSNSSMPSTSPTRIASNRDSVLKDTSQPPSPTTSSDENRRHVHFSKRQMPRIHQDRPQRPQRRESSTGPGFRPEGRQTQNTSRPRAPKDGECKRPELSAVDLKWGQLFSEEGEPTKRLSQVLHGVANYLVLESEPKNSLVISPSKLYTFYSKFKCEKETFPFTRLFEWQTDKELLELQCLYNELRCEYHLVAARPGLVPTVPALTPGGFVEWTTLFLMACPDQEAMRLSKVVEELPIESKEFAVDGTSERLPKQLSRHLIRDKPCNKVEDLMLRAFETAEHQVHEWPLRPPTVVTSPALEDPRRSGRSRTSRHDRPRDHGSAVDDRVAEVEVPRRHKSRHRRSSYARDVDRDETPIRGQPLPSSTWSSSRHGREMRRRDSSPYGSYRRQQQVREEPPPSRPTTSKMHRYSFPSDGRADGRRGQFLPPPSASASTLHLPSRGSPSRPASGSVTPGGGSSGREERITWRDLSPEMRGNYFHSRPSDSNSSAAEDSPRASFDGQSRRRV